MIEAILTPDPQVMNFFASKECFSNAKAEFSDVKSLHKSPLATKIFDLGKIKTIFISQDNIAITKEDTANWDELKPQIIAVINAFCTTGEDAVIPASDSNCSVLENVESLIDARIRPALQRDGGDIDVIGFEDGVLRVSLQGNCHGCPYATITLKEGVEKILKQYIPEIKSVLNEA
ncbi:MAG: NifU family protein [Alphaproteobacteria bacterium]